MNATPPPNEQITRLQEAVGFLEHRQDELVSALDDLSARFDSLLKKIAVLEQRSEQIARRLDEEDHIDQSGPGQPA